VTSALHLLYPTTNIKVTVPSAEALKEAQTRLRGIDMIDLGVRALEPQQCICVRLSTALNRVGSRRCVH